jgi:hypothetical protein
MRHAAFSVAVVGEPIVVPSVHRTVESESPTDHTTSRRKTVAAVREWSEPSRARLRGCRVLSPALAHKTTDNHRGQPQQPNRCNQPALGRCTAALELNGLSLQRIRNGQPNSAAVRLCAVARLALGIGCLGLLVSVTRRRMKRADVFIRSTWAHSRAGLRGRVLRVPYCRRPPPPSG